MLSLFTTMMLAMATAAPIPKDSPILYFPTTVGTKWVYERDGNETIHVISEVARKGKRTFVTVNCVEGEIKSHVRTVAVSEEGVWLVAEGEGNWERLWFKLPVLAGKPKMEGPYIITVIGPEKVEVPAGKFDAIRVDEDHRHLVDSVAPPRFSYWFAPGVGIVKMSSKTGDDKAVVEVLKSFTSGKR